MKKNLVALACAGLLAAGPAVAAQSSPAAAAQSSPAAAASCSTGAYGSPGSFSFLAHFPRTCGGQARAAALVNGQWVHGPWVAGASTSRAWCVGSCPPIRWRAWGYDWRRGPGYSYKYHQLGHS